MSKWCTIIQPDGKSNHLYETDAENWNQVFECFNQEQDNFQVVAWNMARLVCPSNKIGVKLHTSSDLLRLSSRAGMNVYLDKVMFPLK